MPWDPARHGGEGRTPGPALYKAMVGGLASLIAQRLDSRAAVSQLPALAPDAIQFALTPYLGAKSAKEVSLSTGPQGR